MFMLPFFVRQVSMQQERSLRWQGLLKRIAADYQRLPAAEKSWIAERLQQLESLQQRLNRLFEQGSGLQSCADCRGDCCAKGHNHMTLANLLGFLQQGLEPPQPDFSQTCPFLAEQGCRLPVSWRPYNCISFVCDMIENSLTSTEVAEFYRLEQQLRRIYQQFAEHYTGGGLTGLLLQEERLAGRSFLDLKLEMATISAIG